MAKWQQEMEYVRKRLKGIADAVVQVALERLVSHVPGCNNQNCLVCDQTWGAAREVIRFIELAEVNSQTVAEQQKHIRKLETQIAKLNNKLADARQSRYTDS